MLPRTDWNSSGPDVLVRVVIGFRKVTGVVRSAPPIAAQLSVRVPWVPRTHRQCASRLSQVLPEAFALDRGPSPSLAIRCRHSRPRGRRSLSTPRNLRAVNPLSCASNIIVADLEDRRPIYSGQ